MTNICHYTHEVQEEKVGVEQFEALTKEIVY